MHTERITLNAAEIEEARGWLADCEWHDLEPEDFALMCAGKIADAVAFHYEGGLEAFIVASGLR